MSTTWVSRHRHIDMGSQAEDRSSGDVEGDSLAEQSRVEGGSVADTELEEQEEDEHSEAVSARLSRADIWRTHPSGGIG